MIAYSVLLLGLVVASPVFIMTLKDWIIESAFDIVGLSLVLWLNSYFLDFVQIEYFRCFFWILFVFFPCSVLVTGIREDYFHSKKQSNNSQKPH